MDYLFVKYCATGTVVVAMYISPSANTQWQLNSATSELETVRTQHFIIVDGDFKYANLKSVLSTFHQYSMSTFHSEELTHWIQSTMQPLAPTLETQIIFLLCFFQHTEQC